MSTKNTLFQQGEEAHLWVVNLDEVNIDEADCLALLSAIEKDRYHRFLVPHARREFLIGHTLLRYALSYYHPDVLYQDWTFITSEYGRLSLAKKYAPFLIDFNLSHSAGSVVLLLALGHQVGVDIESYAHSTLLADSLQMVFTPLEQQHIQAASLHHPEMLLYYWTLKEAYTKTLGLGLSFDFKTIQGRLDATIDFLHNRSEQASVEVGCSTATGVYVHVHEDCEDRSISNHACGVGYARSLIYATGTPVDDHNSWENLPRKEWQFIQTQIDDAYVVSMAIRKKNNLPVPVRILRCGPSLEIKESHERLSATENVLIQLLKP